MFDGIINVEWGKAPLIIFVYTHFTIIAVTLYLHRCQEHRSIALSPIVTHLFRFWLWLTTGMNTREWVAVHRKHHVAVNQKEDPHSPSVFGLPAVLWKGAELYRQAAGDRAPPAKIWLRNP